MSTLNLTPLLETFSIRSKDRGIIQFPPNWAQRQIIAQVERDYEEGKASRILCLKARQLGVCLDPRTRVLTADLRWVQIDALAPGDQVVAVDEDHGQRRGTGRKMRTAMVEAKRHVHETAYRLTMDNGETLVATGEHRFLSRHRGGTNTHWRQVRRMQAGDVVRRVTDPWVGRNAEDGWFGGLLDGEGSLALPSRAGGSLGLSQVEGPVLRRARDYLKSRGYAFRVERDERKSRDTSKFGNEPVIKLVVSRMDEMFRLVGQTRPTRFIEEHWWKGKNLPGKKVGGRAWSEIVSIEELPSQRMVDLQTSERTFIAEGFVSHNSTVSEAILFAKAITEPGTNAVVVAHDSSSSEVLFNITKEFYESWPWRNMIPHRYATRRQLSLDGVDSNIWVMTAERAQAGRGRTIHALHASEAAFWTRPVDTMIAFNQAMPQRPGTLQIIESTANGLGNWFEEQWTDAVIGRNDFTPLFFPWFKHHEYLPCRGDNCADGTCPTCQADAARLGRLDSEEKDLKKLGATDAHLAWRRWAIPNLCYGSEDFYRQEYPSTDTEAFIVSGVNAFPEPQLKAVFEPVPAGVGRLVRDERTIGRVRFESDATGPLRVYRMPSKDADWGQYFVGADPCFGSVDGDLAAAQVINRQTKEQVAVWHGRINPFAFADELAKLGTFYNQAMIAPEVEGPGYGCVGRLIEIYPRIWQHRWPDKDPRFAISHTNLGWSTNWKRKQWAITKLAETIERERIILHDKATFQELKGYVFYGESGGPYGDVFGPARGSELHDDLVMALAICIICEGTESAPVPYEARPPSRPDGVIMGEPIEMPPETW